MKSWERLEEPFQGENPFEALSTFNNLIMFHFRSGFVQGATNGVAEVPNLIGVYRHIDIFHMCKYASDNIVLKDI